MLSLFWWVKPFLMLVTSCTCLKIDEFSCKGNGRQWEQCNFWIYMLFFLVLQVLQLICSIDNAYFNNILTEDGLQTNILKRTQGLLVDICALGTQKYFEPSCTSSLSFSTSSRMSDSFRLVVGDFASAGALLHHSHLWLQYNILWCNFQKAVLCDSIGVQC